MDAVLVAFCAAAVWFGSLWLLGEAMSMTAVYFCAAFLLIWTVSMIWNRAYSWARESTMRPGLSLYALFTVSVLALLLALSQRTLAGVEAPLLFIASLTVLDVLGRSIVKATHTTRIITVLPEGACALPQVKGVVRIYFALTEELQRDQAEFIRRVRRAAITVQANVIELPDARPLTDDVARNLSWVLRKQHIKIRIVVIGNRISNNRLRVHLEADRALLEIAAPYAPVGVRFGKRLIDVIGSLTLLIVLSPLFVFLALLVMITSPGPVFYRQERVGRDGRLFGILKFRSMSVGADDQLQKLLAAQGTGDTPLFKVENDPRVTSVGKFMRRSSLDELPQLINVLCGTMSLVGPRPQRPAEVALYGGEAGQRLGVLPGMTGMWQVSGRSRLSWEQAMKLDVYYARNWSLWQDLKILCRTASAVVGGDGAQ